MNDITTSLTVKERKAARSRAWKAANPEQVAAYQQAWRAANPDKARAQGAAWVAAHPDRKRAQGAAWREANPAEHAESGRSAKAAAINRRPPWYDKAACVAVYRQALEQTRATGIAHHVDHIFPTCGELVSGLHVAANLQVLTAAENRAKWNRYAP